jgi:hypothetical protein
LITAAPRCLNILATVLLPVATPPVRPTKIMGAEHSTRVLASQSIPTSIDFRQGRPV